MKTGMTISEATRALDICNAYAGRRVPFAYYLAKNAKVLSKFIDSETEILKEEFRKHCVKDDNGEPKKFFQAKGSSVEPVPYDAADPEQDKALKNNEAEIVHMLSEEAAQEGSDWMQYSKEFHERKHEISIAKVKESDLRGVEIEPEFLFVLFDFMVEEE